MPAAVTANATDIDTNDIINTTTTVFYYILYPFAKVIHILYLIALAILRPVWNTLQFISLPVTYLCSFIGYLFSLPIKLILRLEVPAYHPRDI